MASLLESGSELLLKLGPPLKPNRVKDILGKKNGMLTAIEFLGTNKELGITAVWRFQCDCGKTIVARADSFNRGLTLSCGCTAGMKLKGVPSSRRTYSPQEAGYRNKYNHYAAQAKSNARKNLSWSLTFEQWYELSIQDCYWCGAPPRDLLVDPKSSKRVGDPIIIQINGIDRVDNEVGYELFNCVPCCSPCNYEKRTSTPVDFLARTFRRADKWKHLRDEVLSGEFTR